MNPHRLTRIATLLAASLLTASCGTIDPTAFTRHEIEERVVQVAKATRSPLPLRSLSRKLPRARSSTIWTIA